MRSSSNEHLARTVIRNSTTKSYLSHAVVIGLFEDYINDSYSGRRLSQKGTKIRPTTIENYMNLRKLLLEFTSKYNFNLRIYIYDNLTPVQRSNATKWYLKFYRKFTQFLYGDRQCFDNYVGSVIKNLRGFFSYLERDRGVSFGRYARYFHVPKEEIPIIALKPDQLQLIIHSHELANRLDDKMKVIKDIFVFGCTVGLRVSDLLSLTAKNLNIRDGAYYLTVKAGKTNTKTTIKLPPYAEEILVKYENKYATLLPPISKAWLGAMLKRLAKELPDDFVFPRVRERRGQPIICYKNKETKEHFHLSDHISTHTMRRTAITTMLILGMPEHIVRQISGHTSNSKEFYRYVQLTQDFIDHETDQVFNKLGTWNPYDSKSILKKNDS